MSGEMHNLIRTSTAWRVRQITEEIAASRDEERQRILESACGGDDALRKEVLLLLQLSDRCEITTNPAFVPRPGRKSRSMRLGKYRLLKKLGHGSSGVVWSARSVGSDHMLAVKILRRGIDGRRVIEKFELARKVLGRLDHPGIVRLLDVGVTRKGRGYLVMELVDGMPITDYCSRYMVDVADRISLVRDVCSIVQHAHQKGVIHGDLKPCNVMVVENGSSPEIKVVDFGVARLLDESIAHSGLFTGYSKVLCSPEYMSPEQADLSLIDIDTRSDVYSLGAILCEVLSGHPPFASQMFESVGFGEICRVIREVEPMPPSQLAAMVDESGQLPGFTGSSSRIRRRALRGDLDAVVLRCLSKDRERRYPSAKDLGDELTRFLRRRPVKALPGKPLRSASLFISRNQWLTTASAASLAVLVIGFIGADLLQRAQRPELSGNSTDLLAMDRGSGDDDGIGSRLAMTPMNSIAGQATMGASFLGGWMQGGARSGHGRASLHEESSRSHGVSSGNRSNQSVVLSSIVVSSHPGSRGSGPITMEDRGDHHGSTSSAVANLQVFHGNSLREISTGDGVSGGSIQSNEDLLGICLQDFSSESRVSPDSLDTRQDLMNSMNVDPFKRGEERAGGLNPAILGAFETANQKSLEVMVDLIDFMRQHGQEHQSEQLAREVVILSRRLNGEASEKTLEALNILGEVQLKAGRPVDAWVTFEEVRSLLLRMHGPEHPRIVKSLENCARSLILSSRTQDATSLLEKAIRTSRKLFGESHQQTTSLCTLWSEAILAEHLTTATSRLGKRHRGRLAGEPEEDQGDEFLGRRIKSAPPRGIKSPGEGLPAEEQ